MSALPPPQYDKISSEELPASAWEGLLDLLQDDEPEGCDSNTAAVAGSIEGQTRRSPQPPCRMEDISPIPLHNQAPYQVKSQYQDGVIGTNNQSFNCTQHAQPQTFDDPSISYRQSPQLFCKEIGGNNTTQTPFGSIDPPDFFPEQSHSTVIPLRQWIKSEASSLNQQVSSQSNYSNSSENRGKDPKVEALLRKITIAYLIAELLTRAQNEDQQNPSTKVLSDWCSLDNFDVHSATSRNGKAGFSSNEIIEGVEMQSMPLLARMVNNPSILNPGEIHSNVGDGSGDQLRFKIEIDDVQKNGKLPHKTSCSDQQLPPFNSGSNSFGGLNLNNSQRGAEPSNPSERMLCHLFGELMYELLSESPPSRENKKVSSLQVPQSAHLDDVDTMEEPSQKKRPSITISNRRNSRNINSSRGTQASKSEDDAKATSGDSSVHDTSTNFVSLIELGFPSSLSMLVKNLLDCSWEEFAPDNSYSSLKMARDDLKLLLQDPNRFLFEHYRQSFSSTSASSGAKAFDIGKNNLFGREKETTLIRNAFNHVTTSGQSSAFFIAGLSGCGKSSLVENALKKLDSAGGYVVQQKFDELGQSTPLSVVISAFNSLCLLVKEKNSPRDVEVIVSQLNDIFGNHLSTLLRLLPNIRILDPEFFNRTADLSNDNDINLSSIYFTLEHFMRVISSRSRPCVLYLDDLQWSDMISLDLVHSILSDMPESSCVFFIGCYRDNEIQSDHALFRLMEKLDLCNVITSKLHLDGLDRESLNCMVSVSLGVFPRLCNNLSLIIFRKTEGYPLLALELLHSLFDQGLLQYSFRQQEWVWDEDKISSVNISDNVCDLLSTKLRRLPQNMQLALSVASCLGMSIDAGVVRLLSTIPHYSSLQIELDNAVHNGFLDKIGTSYVFAHDKIRESAYNIVQQDNRSQLHHNIGISLYNCISKDAEVGDFIFPIVDQINRGDGSFVSSGERIMIAELNYSAATKSMQSSNFTSAHFYLKAALKFLPENYWSNHFKVSLHLHVLLGKAAYACGETLEAISVLNTVLREAENLSDRLDAYSLLIILHQAKQDVKKAYNTGVDVLQQLGEEIPSSIEPGYFLEKIKSLQSSLGEMSDDDLLGMKVMESSFHLSLMRFYSQVCFASYFVRPKMLHFFACRLVELSLEHGICKYSAMGLAQYSIMLLGKSVKDVDSGYRVGKISLTLLKKFDAMDQVPSVYLSYYGFVATHIEPLQACADMLKRGFEVGMSIGDVSTAFLNGVHYIQKALLSGENLQKLKNDCDYQSRLMNTHSESLSKLYMSAFHETIFLLKDGSIISSEAALAALNTDASNVEEFSESVLFHLCMRSFWRGHYERCNFYAQKYSGFTDIGKLKSTMMLFYQGIAALHCIKTKMIAPMQAIAKKSIKALQSAAKSSKWNYQNKVHLLEAQLYSSEKKVHKAKEAYDAAIGSSKESKFIHEQGLSYELAAFHFKKYKDLKSALSYFERAKECYTEWGSQLKVGNMDREICSIKSKKGALKA